MSFEKKNFEALKQRYPELYDKMMNRKPSGRYQIKSSPLNPQTPNMIDTKTGKLFYESNNPLAGVEAEMRKKGVKLPYFNVFLGAGMFYSLYAFFNVYQPKTNLTIIIEKDPDLFRTVLSFLDMTSFINNNCFKLIVDEDAMTTYSIVNNIMMQTDAKFYAKSINIVEEPVVFMNDKEYYMDAIRAINTAVKETILFFGNDPQDSMIGIDNTFRNMKEIIENPGIKDLKDKFKGKPGVVVSSGPSLNKNIDLLKGLEDKAVICAADGSVKIMKERGLKPHLVTSLERMTPTAKLFEGLTEDDVKDVYLAAAPVIHPETYAKYPGERIITYRNFATFKWIEIDKGILEIGPSAGNMAFKILEYLGCDPIILIGQDLSFGANDETHASGYEFGEVHEAAADRGSVMVEGNYQPQVRTTNVWNTFLKYYSTDVHNSSRKVVNATEGGAKILDTEIITFQEAIDKYIGEDISVLDTIRESLAKPDAEQIREDSERLSKKVDFALKYCEKIMKRFKKNYELCEKIENMMLDENHQPKEYNSKKIHKLITEIQASFSTFSEDEFHEILMHVVQSYYIMSSIEMNGVISTAKDEREQYTNLSLIMKDLFSVMNGLTGEMIKLFMILKTYFSEESE